MMKTTACVRDQEHGTPPFLNAPNCVGIYMCPSVGISNGGACLTDGFHGTRLLIYVIGNI